MITEVTCTVLILCNRFMKKYNICFGCHPLYLSDIVTLTLILNSVGLALIALSLVVTFAARFTIFQSYVSNVP